MSEQKRKMPQDESKLTRNSQIKIRLSKQEVDEVKSVVSEAEMTLADFLMFAVRQKHIVKIPGVLELRGELIREGRNLNQALMLAHIARKEGKPADMQSIRDAALKVEKNLDLLTDLLIKWDVDLTERKQSSKKKKN